MYKDILKRELFFDNSKAEVSQEGKDLIRGLLTKDSDKRLGTKDEKEIRNHPWFADIDFEKILSKEYIPEFIPNVTDERDTNNFGE